MMFYLLFIILLDNLLYYDAFKPPTGLDFKLTFSNAPFTGTYTPTISRMVGHLLRLPLRRRFPRVPQGDAASEHSPKFANMRTNRHKVSRTTHYEGLDRVVREFQDL